MADFRVLGPIEVWHDGTPVVLRRRQQRLILGILLIEANHLVPNERLISLVWGEDPPAAARAILQTRLSELRSALRAASVDAADCELVTLASGYMLRTSVDNVDLHRFRRLVTESRIAESDRHTADLLRRALDLWRGPLLGGLLRSEAHAAWGHGLESARLTAMEDLFEIELRLGNHHEVVDAIVELVAAHPTRERLVAHTLRALHRSARSAEALQTYDRWRRWLGDELGVDPGPEVQQLHLAILRGHETGEPDGRPAPDVPGAAEQRGGVELPRTEIATVWTLPSDIADFTGRACDMALLRERLLAPAEDGHAIVALSGRGGVGKTALCVHVAHQLRAEFPDGVLFCNMHGASRQGAVSAYEVLGRFLTALGVEGEALPEPHDGRVDLYRRLLAGKRVLVVLDNAATDEQVLPLLPSGWGCRVIVNSRVRLGTTFGASVLNLDVLDTAQAVELLAAVAGPERVAAEPESSAELAEVCGHLPLALRVAGAKIAAKPHWTVRKLVGLLRDQRGKLDHFTHGHLDVRASIALSCASLAPDVMRLLTHLGDLDLAEVSVWLSAALLEVSPDVAEALLEQLFDAQLLDFARYDLIGRPRYHLHDLVRYYAMERATTDESYSALARARTRVYGSYLHALDSVYQAVYGGDYLNITGTAPRHPIEEKLADTIATEPMRWFDEESDALLPIVRRAVRDGYSSVCWEIVSTASPLLQMRRQYDRWLVALDVALTAATQHQDRRGKATMRYRWGMLYADRREYAEARRHFQKAARFFEEDGEEHGYAMMIAYTAMVDRFQGRDEIALEQYERALPVLHAAADHGAEAFVHRSIGQIQLKGGLEEPASVSLDRALEIYRTIGSRRGEAQTIFWRGMLRMQQARFEEAQRDFRQALDFSRLVGDRAGEAQSLRGIGQCCLLLGDRDRARSVLVEALRIVSHSGATFLEAQIRQALSEL